MLRFRNWQKCLCKHLSADTYDSKNNLWQKEAAVQMCVPTAAQHQCARENMGVKHYAGSQGDKCAKQENQQLLGENLQLLDWLIYSYIPISLQSKKNNFLS